MVEETREEEEVKETEKEKEEEAPGAKAEHVAQSSDQVVEVPSTRKRQRNP